MLMFGLGASTYASTSLRRQPVECVSACNSGSESLLVHLVDHDTATRRALSRSMLARPYIDRLRSFSRLICPSVWPFDQGSVRAAATAGWCQATWKAGPLTP